MEYTEWLSKSESYNKIKSIYLCDIQVEIVIDITHSQFKRKRRTIYSQIRNNVYADPPATNNEQFTNFRMLSGYRSLTLAENSSITEDWNNAPTL